MLSLFAQKQKLSRVNTNNLKEIPIAVVEEHLFEQRSDSLYDFSAVDIDGELVPFSRFKNKVALIGEFI